MYNYLGQRTRDASYTLSLSLPLSLNTYADYAFPTRASQSAAPFACIAACVTAPAASVPPVHSAPIVSYLCSFIALL